MTMKRSRLRVVSAIAALMLAAGGGATAQEISPSHLQAATDAFAAAPSVGELDALLPFVSESVQNRLIRTRPDLFREIAEVVEAQALALSVRRTDLGNDMARIWARQFSEEELNQITVFFTSEAGQKYKEIAPQVGQDMIRTSRAWSNRVGEELYERALDELGRQGHEF